MAKCKCAACLLSMARWAACIRGLARRRGTAGLMQRFAPAAIGRDGERPTRFDGDVLA
jgi:hypothetical protein